MSTYSSVSNASCLLTRTPVNEGEGRSLSPEGRVLSPDVLKRIIEGHESEEIFEECCVTRDYDDRADLLVNELTKFMNNGQGDIEAEKATSIMDKLTKDSSPLFQATRTDEKLKLQTQLLSTDHHAKERRVDEIIRQKTRVEDQLNQAKNEIVRLEESLTGTIEELAVERNKYSRIQKEVGDLRSTKQSLTSLEMELKLTNQRNEKQLKQMLELESKNKSLKEQLEEANQNKQTALKQDAFTRGFLDESFGLPVQENVQEKISEQECEIGHLRRELESVKRLLNENPNEVERMTEKCASQLSNMERMMVEERDKLIAKFSVEKRGLVEKYENKLSELRSPSFGTSLDDHQVSRLEEKISALEREKSELELRFVNENAEMEQKFRIERAELQLSVGSTKCEYEQSQKYIDFLKFDLNKASLNAVGEVERKMKNEKQDLIERLDGEMQTMVRKHKKEVSELQKSFAQQQESAQKTFAKDHAALKETNAREKIEMEQRFYREKSELREVLKQEYDHNLAVQLADLRKTSLEERTCVEERLAAEKFQLSSALQQEKAAGERQVRELRSTLETRFAEEKSALNEQFQREVALIENRNKREISELQQAFTGGEAGMKGQMRQDFTNMMNKYKNEWQLSHAKEKDELVGSFAREKHEMESAWQAERVSLGEKYRHERTELENVHNVEKEELLRKFQRQKHSLEMEHEEQIAKVQASADEEIDARVERETKLLTSTTEHAKKELSQLREQKKELETKNQILELKALSQQQEAEEAKVFLQEKSTLQTTVATLKKDCLELQQQQTTLQQNIQCLNQEKATILNNSVQEITERQERINALQKEICAREDKIDQLMVIKNHADELKVKVERFKKEIAVKNEEIGALRNVKSDNKRLQRETVGLEDKCDELEKTVQERDVRISRLDEERKLLEENILQMESVHNKELSATKDRLEMTCCALASDKARYTRELGELREQLHAATQSSDRDNALKDKVFHDAKAEVITLNKKLDDKAKRLRILEEANKQLENEIRNKFTTNGQSSYEPNENKQLAEAESELCKAQKEVRQLSDQKRALQRVISKLCNGASNFG